jgi:trimeric autotransporter adhesin
MKKNLPSLLIALFAVLLSLSGYAQTAVQVAGEGNGWGYNGNNLPALSTEMSNPCGITLDKKGALYYSECGNSLVRMVDASGNIVTVAGSSTSGGYNGDNIPATSADLNTPVGIAFDSAGNLYIADFNNERVRKVDNQGNITTVAGNGTAGYNGDSIAATDAELSDPSGVAFDQAGNMYITDQSNQRVRKVDKNGYITTVAGTGSVGYSGDGGAATDADLYDPYAICFDNSGNLYFTEAIGCVVRKVTPSGIITTVAGTGTVGYNGDGQPATDAELANPEGVVMDNAGNMYIADGDNDRIREVTTNGIISTIASATGKITVPGMGWASAVDDDSCSHLFIMDNTNGDIWEGAVTDTEQYITPRAPKICSSEGITLVSANKGASYTWSPSIGLSATTGDTVIAMPTVTTTYFVTVKSTGCNTTSRDVITVVAAPPLTIQPQMPVLCSGNFVTLTVPSSGLDYSWSPSPSLNTATGDSVIATPLVTTTYMVTGKDSLGCMATDSDVVTVLSSPNKPSFIQHNDTLISTSTYDNQWYHNDTLLNDTSQYLIITTLGEYWVVVNNEANGCSTSSDSLNITSLTGVKQLSVNSEQLSVYPNPSSDFIYVSFNSKQAQPVQLSLYNILGQEVWSSLTPANPNSNQVATIPVAGLPDGVYVLRVNEGNTAQQKEVVVAR